MPFALHEIRPVHARGLDLDDHFAWSGRRIRTLDESKDVGRAGRGDFDGAHMRNLHASVNLSIPIEAKRRERVLL